MIHFNALQRMSDIPRFQARTRPDAVAMVFQDRVTSYGTFDQHASQAANGIIAAGCRPDGRIGFLGKNSDLFFEILFGAMKSGTVLVPVNSRLAAPEIDYVLNDAQATLMFVEAEFYDLIGSIRDQLPRITKFIALEGGHPEWQSYAEWRDAQDETDPDVKTGPKDDVIQAYTSGTTGHPKGVQLTNEGYFDVLHQCEDGGFANYRPESEGQGVNLVCMPLFHMAGVNVGILGLAHGLKNIIVREIDPDELLRIIPQYGVETALFVPAVILMLVQHPKARETDFSSFRSITYGASPITQGLLLEAQEMFGCDFIQGYGLTETTGLATLLSAADHAPERDKLLSCGKPNPGTEIRIVDADGRDLPPRAVGEILIRSRAIMKGYWNNPEATRQAIVGDWFYSGDAGYLDEEGYLYIHDRVKDMIVSGGENVYPAEVESALFEHPAVADVAVIGIPSEKWGEEVKGVVVTGPGQSLTAEALIEFAKSRIAGYKVPKTIDFVAELPRNPSGKILRRELRVPYWEGRERQVG